MKNPFVYGGIVTGEDFADRTDEIKELLRDLKDCEKIFLISPRRYGKTSLIVNVLAKLREKGVYPIYIDLYKATSLHKLLEIYTREIALTVETKLERAIRFIKEVLPALRPKVTINGEGNATIGIDYVISKPEVLKFLDQVYDLPQKLALKKKRDFVITFNEFQEIRNFNGESIEKSMRASFQHQRNVGYLFAGSKKHLLNDMVYNKNRAFYKIGKVMNLNKIPREEFRKFLEEKFKDTGFILEKGVVDKVLGLVEEYPYNTQFLCHKLWDMNLDKKKINILDVETGLRKILSEETPFYLSLWDSLTLHQRNSLQAIANFGGEKIFSHQFVATSGIRPSSTLQTSVALLIKKGIIDKNNGIYEIADVFFKEWIKKETF
jgi:AAA+ ATPase superfamily predicted ATPase